MGGFVTVIVMPLTYSIGYGLIAGLACWLGMQAVFSFLKLAFKIEKPDFSMLAEGATGMSITNAVSSAAADVADDGEADEDKKEVKKLMIHRRKVLSRLILLFLQRKERNKRFHF